MDLSRPPSGLGTRSSLPPSRGGLNHTGDIPSVLCQFIVPKATNTTVYSKGSVTGFSYIPEIAPLLFAFFAEKNARLVAVKTKLPTSNMKDLIKNIQNEL